MRVVLYGAGTIAPTHVEALQSADVEIVGYIDPDRAEPLGSAGRRIPSISGVDALPSLQLDAVLVATPSGSHAGAIQELSRRLPGVRLLVEKPAATTAVDYGRAMAAADAAGSPVLVLLHAAYAPEVAWAEAHLAGWAERHGGIRRILTRFCDPYGRPELETRRSALVSSWIDSGINALAVLDRLVAVQRIVRAGPPDRLDHAARAEASVEAGAVVPVTILTSWRVAEPSKSTILDFGDGATLILDHQAVAGWMLGGGSQQHFRTDSDAPRLTLHYREMFRSHAAASWASDRDRSDWLHHLLFSAT